MDRNMFINMVCLHFAEVGGPAHAQIYIYIYIYINLSRFKTYENICFLEACAVGVRSGGTVGWVRGTVGRVRWVRWRGTVGTVEGYGGYGGGVQ